MKETQLTTNKLRRQIDRRETVAPDSCRTQRRMPECSEWQSFEDDLWNPFDSNHNVAPDSWCVEDVRRTAVESPDDVASHLLRIGEARGVWQSIGHRGLDWSRFDGNYAHPS